MLLIPLICLLIGVYAALLLNHPLNGVYGQYLAVACLGGLDSVCGGIRSGLEGKFRSEVFLTGFLANIALALAMIWLGTRLYLELTTVIAFIFGLRIFNNLSLIRRFLITRWNDARERRRLAVSNPTAHSGAALGQADPTA